MIDFSKSIFVSEEKFNNWLKKSDPKALESDPGYIYMATVITKYRELYTVNRSNEQKLDEGKQKWMKILFQITISYWLVFLASLFLLLAFPKRTVWGVPMVF